MVFQEMVKGAREETFNINIEKRKRRSINIDESGPSTVHSVDPIINLAWFSSSSPEEETYQSTKEQLFNLWTFMRYSFTNEDEIPRFIGLIVFLYSQKRLPTSLTYLLPLQNPITEVYTMTKIFEISQNVSKVYAEYEIHTYNLRPWCCYQSISCDLESEWALEKDHYSPWSLFIQHFMRPEALEIISLLKLYTNEEGSNYMERATDQGVDEVIERYKKLRWKGLNGDFEKTLQCWLIYTSMINQIQMLHMTIKTNDLSLKIKCCNDLLPLCFTTNRVIMHDMEFITFSCWKTWMHHILRH